MDLLRIKHNACFINGSLLFGFRHGSVSFQRCSDVIHFITQQHGFHCQYNYIDDLIYVGLPQDIYKSYEFLQHLLQNLGLKITKGKLVPPTTAATCLGILVDIPTSTISIPSDKLLQITETCKLWASKTYCSKHDLQSLLSSLLYNTKCVKGGSVV